jgi:hypothetical protein
MIYIIITTCILNKVGIHDFNHRKNRYIDCIQSLLKWIENDSSIKPIIVENNGQRPTYLDDLGCSVLYTNNNMIHYKNKGVNELMDIKEVIRQYNIQDDDMIIKLTGRYKITSMNLIDMIKKNIDKYDAFVKFYNVCTFKYMVDDCVLGLFAIKCKYLKEFAYQCIKSPECEFAEYVRQKTSRIMELNNLYLECCFADDLRILYV